MKPHEHFVEHILGALRAGRGHGHGHGQAAATALIQDALRNAGLLDLARPGAGLAGGAPLPGFTSAPTQAPTQARGAQVLGPGAFLRGSHAEQGGARGYRLYLPARAAAGPPPLVVMLHGCTQDAEDFAAGTTMNLLAERSGCLVLYPEQDPKAHPTRCWHWFEPAHQQRGRGEPAIIAGMTRRVVREHGADPARVYVAGLSAGGAMAALLAAAYPELYAAVGVHSGLAAGGARDLVSGLQAMKGKHPGRPPAPLRRVPAIVFHGDRDATVHPSNGEAVFRQFAGQPATELEQSGDGHTRSLALDDAGRVMAEHWRLHGAGHAWSGGSAAGSHAVPDGPNAAAEMLRFFLFR